ncbi:hypothetical protein DYD21_01870 [Rhodohalobacter sp. SW132]|uniref:hypothetical protein n=1 Tax=Rhodohalobacter sp. SW132 TaxID=2293433 RepID=UPI000E261D78|nr:hypothetical protein [Rhodohalobacter sp. SW132]REL38723.1 hypothetical protein DYD21_01870 [Rhodohalobacter sp. SW132]
MSLELIFLSLFVVTFIVALVAFAAYGYLLVLLMRNHSEKFNPKTTLEFLLFLWKLFFYYVHRAFTGFFGIEKGKGIRFISEHNKAVKDAESQQSKLIKVYSIFSAAYILFFILFIWLVITFLYMVLGPFF